MGSAGTGGPGSYGELELMSRFNVHELTMTDCARASPPAITVLLAIRSDIRPPSPTRQVNLRNSRTEFAVMQNIFNIFIDRGESTHIFACNLQVVVVVVTDLCC